MNPEVIYAMWRFHAFTQGFGSYETIDYKVEHNQLEPFTCSEPDCDCKWAKVSKEIQNCSAKKQVSV
jgi:hypothetical protein